MGNVNYGQSNDDKIKAIIEEIARRDAKVIRTNDLIREGYAATSGQVVNRAEEIRKEQADNLRQRIEAGEKVDTLSLLQYGFGKVDEARKAAEADGKTDDNKEGDKAATVEALKAQLDAITAELAKHTTN